MAHCGPRRRGSRLNTAPDFIANLQSATDEHQLVKLSVLPDGTYTVTNTRNGFSKTYHAGMARGR